MINSARILTGSVLLILLALLSACAPQTSAPAPPFSSNEGGLCGGSVCQTPTEFLIQSNCPFQSACIEGQCKVVCPLFTFDPLAGNSFPVQCEADSDCDCNEREQLGKNIDCICLSGNCVSVEGEGELIQKSGN